MTHPTNPHGGRTPYPADPREMAAAVRAGHASIDAAPYYVWRYGERGRRFATSDSGYLTTLADGGPDHATRQVQWLSRVLSARGMPRVLVEVHLPVLVASLTEAVPERREVFEHLLVASEALRLERELVQSRGDVEDVAHAFQRALTRHDLPLFRRTGRLIAAAAADEAWGIRRAVASLEEWLSDEDLFPAPWCLAVEGAIRHARKITRRAPRGYARSA